MRKFGCALLMWQLLAEILAAQCTPPVIGQDPDSCCFLYPPTAAMTTCPAKPVSSGACDRLTVFPTEGPEVEDDGAVCDFDPGDELFTIYALPDTQRNVQRNTNGQNNPEVACYRHYYCMMLGVAGDAGAGAVDFVTHVGDIVHGQQGRDDPFSPEDGSQWYLATLGAEVLQLPLGGGDGVVPFSFAIGNHDYDEWPPGYGGSCGDPHDMVGTDCYQQNFGAEAGSFMFNGHEPTWHVDQSPSGGSSIQEFSTDAGDSVLHVSLEYRGSDTEIEWVREQLDSLPVVPTILTTHSYLTPSRTEREVMEDGMPVTLPPHSAFRSCLNSTPAASGYNSGADIAEKLVHLYPQIFLVLSGHVSGASMAQDRNFLDWKVIERVVDYQGLLIGNDQTDQCGGDGWYDKIHVVGGNDPRIVFDTESFSYVQQGNAMTDISGCQRCGRIDFVALYDELDLAKRQIVRLPQDCVDPEACVADTYIEDGLGPFDLAPDILIRQADTGIDERQGLIRFDPLPPVPDGMALEKAVLTLTLEGEVGDPSAGVCATKVFPMLDPWTEDTVWGLWDMDGVPGIQADNNEAAATCDNVDPDDCVAVRLPTCAELHDADAPACLNSPEAPRRTTRSFDVTTHVARWLRDVNPQPNNGWVILPDVLEECPAGTELFFRSSNWPQAAENPALTLSFAAQ